MCFSAEASFTAAAVLAVMGFVTLSKAKKHPERYLIAALPLFFALQQITEGIQWLYYQGSFGTEQGAGAARELFLFMALILWPFWIPLSILVAEKKTEKRRLLYVFLLIGLFDALYNGYYSLFQPTNASILENSIYYHLKIDRNSIWIYAAATVLPWFFTSTPKAKILGLGFALGYAVSAWFFYSTFTSVWCFFAAINSLIIYAMVTSEDR